jgi:hypothetical protein
MATAQGEMMDKSKNGFKKILDYFVNPPAKPENPPDDTDTTKGLLTRQELLDHIFEHFKYRFKEETTDESMLFPTSFCVNLHPDDYRKRDQGFGSTVKDAANKFHKFLRDRLGEYPDYRPHAQYWSFQFSSCSQEATGDVMAGQVKIGEPIIATDIFSLDFSNISAGKNIVATIKPKNSNVVKTNVTDDFLKGLNPLGKDWFHIDFDKTFKNVTSEPFSHSEMMEKRKIAELHYTVNRQPLIFSMVTETVQISGRNDQRKGAQFLRLDDENLKDGHVQIKFFADEKRFRLAAYGKARLNEKLVPVSRNEPQWVDLPDNATIFIDDSETVKFLIKK